MAWGRTKAKGKEELILKLDKLIDLTTCPHTILSCEMIYLGVLPLNIVNIKHIQIATVFLLRKFQLWGSDGYTIKEIKQVKSLTCRWHMLTKLRQSNTEKKKKRKVSDEEAYQKRIKKLKDEQAFVKVI